VITKSWFADNAAQENGGAILSRCNITVEETQFERNRTELMGGAIYLTHGVDASMRKVLFRENQARGSGGAIAGLWDLQLRGSLRIRHDRFERNSAARAGGTILPGEASVVDISVRCQHSGGVSAARPILRTGTTSRNGCRNRTSPPSTLRLLPTTNCSQHWRQRARC
jgi:hypothetical protein